MSNCPTAIHKGMYNEFKAEGTGKSVNFRNKDNDRTSVSSIEIFKGHEIIADIAVDTDDNVAMALSLLGVGRVTDDVEDRAAVRANFARENYNGVTLDDMLDIAIVNLRAILIAKQREKEAESKDIEDAYFLYLLAYPKGTVRVEFESTGLKDHWVSVLRKVRKDPTVLGAL